MIYKKLKYYLINKFIYTKIKLHNMDLESEFNKFVTIGYNTRYSQIDGLKAWQPYKKEYQDIKLIVKLKNSFIEFVNSLNYTFTDKDHEDAKLILGEICIDNVIPNHFLIQHIRIPKLANFELSLLKFCQLAYNIGQIKACFQHEHAFDQSIIDFYFQNQLDKFSTYID